MRGHAERPAPLPPEERTVGQLVAEAIRLYGRRFWASLALGAGPALAGVTLAALDDSLRLPFALTAGALLLTLSYAGASRIALDADLEGRSLAVALVAGVVVLVPVPFLTQLLLLPAVAWLALVGLVVPVALVERRGLAASFGRALRLARADYVHALGSLAALAIVGFLTATVLYWLLLGFGDTAAGIAALLALLVITPLLFLGAALVYDDQRARLESRSD